MLSPWTTLSLVSHSFDFLQSFDQPSISVIIIFCYHLLSFQARGEGMLGGGGGGGGGSKVSC